MAWFLGSRQPRPQMTPAELAQALAGPTPPVVLDVREPFEWRSGHIPGAKLISLGQLPQHLADLPKDKEIVAICRSGHRSMVACSRLAAEGFQVKNLAGGYLHWSGELQLPQQGVR
ncbi:MAG: rhodanese-like domain-containing protein [Sulfobacillus sp.]